MAKSLIYNVVGDYKQWVTVPATATVAQAFAEGALEGFWEVFNEVGTEGSDVVTIANDANVMLKNAAGLKTYISMLVKETVNTTELINALKGKTINGVHADEVYILGFKRVTF